MGNRGGDFAKASRRELRKQNSGEAPANIGKGVTVEEKKRRAAMAGSQEVERFSEGATASSLLVPFSCDRWMSL